MPEENQITGQKFWMYTYNLRDWANDIVEFQKQAREQQRDKFSTDRDNEMKNIIVSWLTTTDHGVAQNCNKATRIWQVAKWIREYFIKQENWGIDYYNVDDVPLVDSFKDSNPEYEDKIWEYVLDEGQICDPNQLYQELWFYWEPQVEETVSMDTEETGPDNFIDWVKNVWKNFLSFYETWWDAVRNAVDWTLWTLEWDQTMWAINNYMRMNNVPQTAEGYAEARAAVSTPEWMDMYKPSIQRVILKWMESWIDAALTIYAPYMKWVFSIWENVPWISNLLEIAWVVMQWGWWLVNHISPLYFFRDTLQTDEEKKEFDSFVGTLWFMKLFQKRSGRDKVEWWWIKETLLKEIDPETTIKEFQKRVTDLPSDAKKGLKSVWKTVVNGAKYTRDNLIQPAIERKTNQWNWERRMPEVTDPVEIDNIKWKINKKSWEITNAVTPEARQKVTNTLWRLSNADREAFSQQKDLWQLSNTISEKLEKPIIETEDKILSNGKSLVTRESVEEKYWGQELVTDDNVLWEVSSSTWPAARWDVVNKAFNSFFDMSRKTEWTKSIDTSAMENLYKKYNDWAWLTSLELYQLARYLTRKFRVFQRDWSWTIRDTISAKYINDLRTALKNIAKDNIREEIWAEYADYLDILDKFYWDAAVTNDLLSKRYINALKEENTVPSKNHAQEMVSGLPMTIAQIKSMWKDLFGWGSKSTPYSVNSELNYKLKLWDEDFDMLWRKLEWPSLEEIIREVEKLWDKETTWMSTKTKQDYYNNQFEWLRELLKSLGYTEEEINAELSKTSGYRFIEEWDAYKEYDRWTKATTSKAKRELTNLKKWIGWNSENSAWLFTEE